MEKPPLVMEICVFDASAGEGAEAEQVLLVDISTTQHRIWLSSFVAWAMHDNKVLEMVPAPGKTPTFVPKAKSHKRREK